MMISKFALISIIYSIAVPAVLAGECTPNMGAEWIGKTQFSVDIAECAKGNMGMAVATSECLRGLHPVLSPECSACFGQTVSCGAKNCAGFCLGAEFSPECLACTKTAGCDAALAVCTGITEGPPVPGSTASGASDSTSTTTDNSAVQMTMSVGSIVLMLVLVVAF